MAIWDFAVPSDLAIFFKPRPRPWVIIVAATGTLLCHVIWGGTVAAAETVGTPSPAPNPSPVEEKINLFDLTPVGWKNQNGVPFGWESVRGQVALLALIFTSCEGACPLIVQELQAIVRKFSEKEQKSLRILLFSIDPKRDSVAKIKKFATAHALMEPKWQVLTGTESGARELATALGGRYKKTSAGDYSHSNGIYLLDQYGSLVATQPELNKGREDTLKDLRILLAKSVVNPK